MEQQDSNDVYSGDIWFPLQLTATRPCLPAGDRGARVAGCFSAVDLLLVQNLPHRAGERAWRVWLFEPGKSALRQTLLAARRVGITRHQQDLNSSTGALDSVRQFALRDAGHCRIGQQQLDAISTNSDALLIPVPVPDPRLPARDNRDPGECPPPAPVLPPDLPPAGWFPFHAAFPPRGTALARARLPPQRPAEESLTRCRCPSPSQPGCGRRSAGRFRIPWTGRARFPCRFAFVV